MIKYVYASKNVKSGNFNTPVLENFNEEAAKEAYEISFKEAGAGAKEQLKELDIYYLGTFDTKTGFFKQVEPVFLVSGAAVLGD